MHLSKLLVSNLSITEDEYSFGGSFILSDGSKNMHVDISELENGKKQEEIKSFFNLSESRDDIRSHIMHMVVEKASISSRIKEGEDYHESSKASKDLKAAGSLDMS